MKKAAAVLCVAALLLASCMQDVVYDKYESTPLSGWEKNDTLSFSVPHMQRNGDYDVGLGLRINTLYPFMGLTLIVEQTVFPAQERRIDTLDCKLIDKNGKSLGQGVSYYQYNFPINHWALKQGDSLQVYVRHDMKREILPGISDIGIQLRQCVTAKP